MSISGTKGGTGSAIPVQSNWANAFPARPVPKTNGGFFSGFLNSPIGQRMSGKPDPIAEIYGGMAPTGFDLLKQQLQYNQARQDSLTPTQRRQKDMFATLAQSGQQPSPPSFSPVQFSGPANGGILTEVVQALLARQKGGM
jgi:hypothetical protein